MTSVDMKNAFLLLYDINGNVGVGFTDEEIYELLSKAQENIAIELFNKVSPSEMAELSVVESKKLVQSNLFPNMYLSDLKVSDKAIGIIGASVNIKRSRFPDTNGNYEWFDVDMINPSQARNFIVSSFNQTVFKHPKMVVLKTENVVSDINIFVDTYSEVETSTYGMKIAYSRLPNAITETDNSELNAKWHQDIVDAAVKLAEFVTNDNRAKVQA
jgi:hypothetical protein